MLLTQKYAPTIWFVTTASTLFLLSHQRQHLEKLLLRAVGGVNGVGGMLIGTLALLFVVPVFYIIFEYLQEKVRPPMEEEADMQVLLEKQKSEAERAKD